LNEVFTPDALEQFEKELGEEEKKKLLEFLPAEQQDIKYLPSTFRSPQFQQAVNALSRAANSENVQALFI
jgi:hypothetical protein